MPTIFFCCEYGYRHPPLFPLMQPLFDLLVHGHFDTVFNYMLAFYFFPHRTLASFDALHTLCSGDESGALTLSIYPIWMISPGFPTSLFCFLSDLRLSSCNLLPDSSLIPTLVPSPSLLAHSTGFFPHQTLNLSFFSWTAQAFADR